MTSYVKPAITAVSNGELDPGSEGPTIIAEVKRSKEWYGKTLTLHVGEQGQQPFYSKTQPTPNNDRSALWQIPTESFVPYLGKPLTAWYTLDSELSEALAFTVKANFGAPQAVDLRDKPYIVLFDNFVNAYPPARPPEYAQLSRTVANATRYTSSLPNVASVDNAGNVTLLANTAFGGGPDEPVTITALDAAGAPLGTYALSISGIKELSLLSPDASLYVQAAVNTVSTVDGLRMPTAEDFASFKALYPQIPDEFFTAGVKRNAGFLGGRDNAGKVAFFDLQLHSVISAEINQQGYAVGITDV